MKSFLLFCFSFCFIASANAQFGIAIKYDKNNYSEWDTPNDPYLFDNSILFKSDLTIGVNYWMRLKKYRIEFLPEVSYTLKNSEKSRLGIIPSPLFEIDMSRIGFQFHTQIYPMDIEGDCNCPTWGKDNDFLKKGLYFTLSPGVDYFINDAYSRDQEVDIDLDNSLAFKIGVGIGVDIGLSKLVTLSPFVLLNYYPNISSDHWIQLDEVVCQSCTIERSPSSNTQVQAGVRFIFRPDYKY